MEQESILFRVVEWFNGHLCYFQIKLVESQPDSTTYELMSSVFTPWKYERKRVYI